MAQSHMIPTSGSAARKTYDANRETHTAAAKPMLLIPDSNGAAGGVVK